MSPFETPAFQLIPLWKIASEFRTTVEELKNWYGSLGIDVGHIAGQPAIEQADYIAAYGMTVDKPEVQQNQPVPPLPQAGIRLPAELAPFDLTISEQGLIAEFIEMETAILSLAESFWSDMCKAPDLRKKALGKKSIQRLVENGEVIGEKMGSDPNSPWCVNSLSFVIFVLNDRLKKDKK